MKLKQVNYKSAYLLLFLFVILVFPRISLASILVTKTFDDSYDWGQWIKSNIQEDNSGGLRLQNSGNLYETDGYATYQFSPGGINNSWKSVSTILGNTSVTSNGSSTLQILFSPDNSTWFDEGNLNNGLIPDSAGMYIKATFHGNTTESQILKSIALSYQTKEEPRILILKRTFKKDSDINPIGTETSTFEPGDTAIVRVKIDPMGLSGLNLNVRDYRPFAFNMTPITTTAGCGLSPTDNLMVPTFVAGNDESFSSWSNVKPGSGHSYLCYQYTLNNTPQPKNDLVQSKLIAYDQNNFDENQTNNQPLAVFSGYQMVKGFAFSDSTSLPAGLASTNIFPIDDFLSFARTTVQYTAGPGTISNLSYSASYTYKRGLGQRSRGGELYSLPVKMENDAGQVIATDQSYILYNPAFYLFGNLFSGSGLSSKLDFSSRSGSVSTESFPSDRTSKLNSEAALYNYNFDKNSVLYWDKSNVMKNKSLEENINSLTGTNPPPVVCSQISQNSLSGGKDVYLDNPNCQINSSSLSQSRTYPAGRVWIIRAQGNVDLAATFHRQGTIIIDFQGNGGTVNISTALGSFSDAKLGLIVIGGGKVVFGQGAQEFNGLIFAPSSSSCTISFEEGGSSIQIKGSLVSDTICFNSREKTGLGMSSQYSVSILIDQGILNSGLPGFENLLPVIIGD